MSPRSIETPGGDWLRIALILMAALHGATHQIGEQLQTSSSMPGWGWVMGRCQIDPTWIMAWEWISHFYLRNSWLSLSISVSGPWCPCGDKKTKKVLSKKFHKEFASVTAWDNSLVMRLTWLTWLTFRKRLWRCICNSPPSMVSFGEKRSESLTPWDIYVQIGSTGEMGGQL